MRVTISFNFATMVGFPIAVKLTSMYPTANSVGSIVFGLIVQVEGSSAPQHGPYAVRNASPVRPVAHTIQSESDSSRSMMSAEVEWSYT